MVSRQRERVGGEGRAFALTLLRGHVIRPSPGAFSSDLSRERLTLHHISMTVIRERRMLGFRFRAHSDDEALTAVGVIR